MPLVIFLGVLVFDAASLRRLRFTALDLPMAAFCVAAAPLVARQRPGLVRRALRDPVPDHHLWAFRTVCGRIYFSSPDGLRRLALGMLAGGLIYVPLCLWRSA